MNEMISLEKIQERVILVGVSTREEDCRLSLQELEELVATAGAKTVGCIIQNREAMHPGTYIGKGKIEEVKEMLWELDATGIVCDDELAPAQMKNLEEELDCKIMDRTMVILDIFAARASTSEGKLQVELAQLKYRQARLIGMRSSLSRLGGGIGTRGPGEKKLEMDRRLIKERISRLNKELSEVVRHRETLRSARERSGVPVAAIVGYTNAGKSTLLNKLTKAQVLEMDQLFATLDPVTRALELPDKQEVLLSDTVGFIRKLPHHLINAFRSTLEEAKYADVIIHVADASNPQMDQQMYVVYETLKELEVAGKPVITLFNKCDKLLSALDAKDLNADYSLQISARTGEGLSDFMQILSRILTESQMQLERVFPYTEAGKIQTIRKFGRILEEEYREDGIFIRAYIPKNMYEKVAF